MKRNSAELKRIARGQLQGHYSIPMCAMMLTQLIVSAITMPFAILVQGNPSPGIFIVYFIATLIINLLAGVLQAGLMRIHLRIARGEQPMFMDLFYAFKARPDRFILAGLVMAGISFVCMIPAMAGALLLQFSTSESAVLTLTIVSLVLVVVGCVPMVFFTLRFALATMLLVDQDTLGALDALRESSRLMKGNMGRYLYINLSFIGWTFLCTLSLLIGTLWVEPYMSQTTVTFYRDVTQEI